MPGLAELVRYLIPLAWIVVAALAASIVVDALTMDG